MTPPEIEALLALISSKTESEAAQKLFITQSTLSRRLKNLEKSLGYELIKRSRGKKEIVLTDRGKEFIPLALRLKYLWKNISALKTSTEKKKVRIVASNGPNIYVLPQVYIDFYYQNPQIDLEISTMRSELAYKTIENERADFGFVVVPYQTFKTETIPIYREKMLFVCSNKADYPQIISPTDLDPQKYVYCVRPVDFNLWLERWFGPSYNPSIKCDLIPLMESFIVGTDNWTILPASFIPAMRNSNIRAQVMVSPPPDRTIYCVKGAGAEQIDFLIADFLNLIKERVKLLEHVTFLADI